MMSGVGGFLSLYLGISIAMVFEILEFLVDMLGNQKSYKNSKLCTKMKTFFGFSN